MSGLIAVPRRLIPFLLVSAVIATPVVAMATGAATRPKLSIQERLRLAFRAATGVEGMLRENVDGEIITTIPLRIINAPFGPILLTKREAKGACHGCGGAIGVYYLREKGHNIKVAGSWPQAIKGWGWGTAPDWHVTNKFTTFPAIYSEGGFTGQGITCGGGRITELRPEGPVNSDTIWTYFSNTGTIIDDRISATKVLEGKIINIRRNTSFEVRVSGTSSFIEKYVWRGKSFVRASAESKLLC